MENTTIDYQKRPNHVAIIMDGNGRWGQVHFGDRKLGYRKSLKSIKLVIRECINLNIPYLTFFAFSKENWGRPKDEVDFIFNLINNSLKKEISNLLNNNIKLNFIGDINDLPNVCQQTILDATNKSNHNTGLILTFAISYSGRWEIINAVKNILKAEVNINDVNESLFTKFMQSSNLVYPDLLIRTGGEKRISNFFLWQIAYTEVFFSDILWPDFTLDEFKEALIFYQKRIRKFGKLIN